MAVPWPASHELHIIIRQIQTTPIFLRHPLRALQCTTRRKFREKNFIFLENFAKFDLQNSNSPSIFLRSCESRMTVTTMASHEEEAGSDELSDEEVFPET